MDRLHHLKDQGWSNKRIAEDLRGRGYSISESTVRRRLSDGTSGEEQKYSIRGLDEDTTRNVLQYLFIEVLCSLTLFTSGG